MMKNQDNLAEPTWDHRSDLNLKENGKSPVIAIGLDCADPNLVELWLKQSRLPYMKTLLKKGIWAKLSSIASGFSDTPWLSFNTGVSPGKHGCYNFLELQRETSSIKRMDVRSCGYLPFWSLLRDTGKKVALFDVPKTYPVKGLNGIQISAWGEDYPMFEPCSLPLDLVSILAERFGKYRHTREILNPRFILPQIQRYHTLMSGVEKKLQAIKFVMDQDDWDLVIASFGESHCANHLFYHFFNESHWAYDPKVTPQLKEALLNIYSKLDAALATLLRNVSEQATILIFSVHGIATNYSANHLMPLVMEKLGFQVSPVHDGPGWVISSGQLWQGLRTLIPAAIRDLINDWILPQSFHDKMHSHQFKNSIDWQKTKAFFLPIGHFQGFISINLKGRDPYGSVEPGAEYEQLCNQICQEMKLLINPETGKPAVHDAIKVSQLVQGENLHKLPDIIIQWDQGAPINQLHHPRLGTLSGQFYGLRKTQHTGEGFLIAAGKLINRSAVLANIDAVDLAPTILYLLGQSIPEYMEGKVLLELINEDFKHNNPIKYTNTPRPLS